MFALDDRPPTAPVAPAGTQASYEGATTASAAFRDITLDDLGHHGTQIDIWICDVMGFDDYYGGRGRVRLQLIVLEDLTSDAPVEGES
jgi:hypothetical protein